MPQKFLTGRIGRLFKISGPGRQAAEEILTPFAVCLTRRLACRQRRDTVCGASIKRRTAGKVPSRLDRKAISLAGDSRDLENRAVTF